MDPLTLSAAVTQAGQAGVKALVLAGVSQEAPEVLVSIDSADSESVVRCVRGYGHRRIDVQLEERSQSGPERWDYPLRLPTLVERYVLRLSRGSQSIDIAFGTAVHALLRAYGWHDDALRHLTEPLIPVVPFRQALERLESVEELG